MDLYSFPWLDTLPRAVPERLAIPEIAQGTKMSEIGEGVDATLATSPDEECDHDWEVKSEEPIQRTIEKNNALADHLKKSPSKHGAMRGYLFENQAIIANEKVLDIKKTAVLYKCKKCGQEQDVDIVGADQIAEAKSRAEKQVKKKGDQSRRLRSIQSKMFNPGKKPLAKIDGSLSDSAGSKEIYLRRGFDVEIVS